MYQVVPEMGKNKFFKLLPTNKIQNKKQTNERDSCKGKHKRRQLNTEAEGKQNTFRNKRNPNPKLRFERVRVFVYFRTKRIDQNLNQDLPHET